MVELSHRLVGRRPAIAGLVVVLAAIALLPPHAEADAPPCRYTIDIPADTVHDNDTGLTWQRTVDGATYNHSDAMAYCANLPLDGGGWRLPSIQELQTIVDVGTAPAIDLAAFPDTPTDNFWSSSVFAGDPNNSAWFVFFHTGSVSLAGVVSMLSIRCVR